MLSRLFIHVSGLEKGLSVQLKYQSPCSIPLGNVMQSQQVLVLVKQQRAEFKMSSTWLHWCPLVTFALDLLLSTPQEPGLSNC